MSDADSIDIRDDVREAVRDAGYTLVDDPTKANFRLRATIRYYGENEAADEGRGLARGMGAVGGAATGIAAGVGASHLMHSAGSNSGLSTGIGIGAGIGAGSVAAIAISNRMKAREWNLIVDLILEERLDKPITFSVASDRGVDSNASTGVYTGRAGVEGQHTGGGARDSTSTVGYTERTSDFFPHGMRLTAWARQIGMKSEEALPLLRNRIRNVLPKAMPE
jgi:hypothetical protein